MQKTYSIEEICMLCGVSGYYARKKLKDNKIVPANPGSTRRGDGCRYSENDIAKVFPRRFLGALDGTDFKGIVCPICGNHSYEATKWTHGLCGECWCRELNKSLIDKHMPLEDATRETVERLKVVQIITG